MIEETNRQLKTNISNTIPFIMSEVQVTDYECKVLTSEDVAARIEELRNLMKEDEDLQKMRSDDAYLLRFLHRTQFHVKRAYRAVKRFHLYIIEEADWIPFDITDDISTIMDMNMRVMLNAFDNGGKKIFYLRTDTVDASKITVDDLMQLEFVWLESVMDDPKVQANGICILIDTTGFSWRLMSWITPVNIRRCLRRFECFALKDVTIHVIRCSSLVKVVIKMVWPLLPVLIKERIKFHFESLETIYEDIRPENIPKECGGSLDVDFNSLNAELLARDEEMRKKLEHYRLIAS